MPTPFHVALAVRNIAEAAHFYGQIMGLPKGRSSSHWIDFDLFGHQFVVHLDERLGDDGQIRSLCNPVDDKAVPIPHCGAILNMPEWRELAERLRRADVAFLIEPYIRFEGQPGEQGTFFFTDPSGNALEFKGFADIDADLFAT